MNLSPNNIYTRPIHSTIYDSNRPTMIKLPNYTFQLLTNITNVKHLLYSYANVMQKLDSSFCGLLTIAYVVDIIFGFNPKKSIYTMPQICDCICITT